MKVITVKYRKKKKADLNSQRTAGIGLLGTKYKRTKSSVQNI